MSNKHVAALSAASYTLQSLLQEREQMVKLLEALALVITPNHHAELAKLNWALLQLKEEPKEQF